MTTTVAEIGRLAGCSGATVSRALNNSGSVSPETREAVFRAVKETRYIPKTVNRRSERGTSAAHESQMVELLMYRHTLTEPLSFDGHDIKVGPLSHFPDSQHLRSKPYRLSSSFYRRIIDGVTKELAAWDCRTVLQLNEDLTDAALLREVNLPDRAGVLLMGEYGPQLGQFIACCQRPLVLVDLIHPGPVAVTTDNLAGIGLAFDHLYGRGHRRIGFVGRNDQICAFAERFSGFRLKMADAGLSINPRWIYQGPSQIESTAEGMRPMLLQAERPTAFVCSNDCYALGVIRAASSLNIRIPHDLSVVGFDDEESASLVTPPLTTVRVPAADIGRQAVRQLMIQVRSPDASATSGYQVRLVPNLIERQSTAAAPTAPQGLQAAGGHREMVL